MTREAKDLAEEITAQEMDLTLDEVRAFVLSTAKKEDRKNSPKSTDWLHIDAVALRAVRKVSISHDLTHAGARETIRDTFLSNYEEY